MGQMRSDAGRGSFVRATNQSGWIHVEEDPDYNVASVGGDALTASVGAMLTLVNRAPMAPGTICFTFTDAAGADARLLFEVRGRDANGQHRSERLVMPAAATVAKLQSKIGYIWIDSIKLVSAINLASGDSLVVGYDNTNANGNTGAGLIIPGRPRSESELVVQFVDAFTDPPALATAQSTTDFGAQLWYPAFRTGNRSYRFVVHPDRC
jgi:hypothetical protein